MESVCVHVCVWGRIFSLFYYETHPFIIHAKAACSEMTCVRIAINFLANRFDFDFMLFLGLFKLNSCVDSLN